MYRKSGNQIWYQKLSSQGALYMVLKLDLKNCSFAVIRPTLHWRCRLNEPLKAKKSFFWVEKTFPNVTDYFIVTFYFSNASLSSVERKSSNKRPQRLLNFEIARCGANYREALISELGKWTILNVKTLSFFFKNKNET